MRIKFNANLIRDTDRHDTDTQGVTLDFPDLHPMCLEGLRDVKAMDPVNGDTRELTDDEVRDLEHALEEFHVTRMAKALRKYIVTQY